MFIKECQIKSANNYNLNGFDTLVLGDEGCGYKALRSDWMNLFKRAADSGLKVRYLTPIAPQKVILELFERIKEMSEISRYKVTFNDYGLLYLCRQLIEDKKIVPVLGRVLTRSILDCAWYPKLLENESEELNKAISKHSFQHSSKMEMLKRNGIEEIEVNINSSSDLAYFKDMNIRLTGYLSNAIVAVGRVCYSARWHKLDIPLCKDELKCINRIDIELQELWGKSGLMNETPTEEMCGYYKDNYIEGNIVFKELKYDLSDPYLDNFDNLIITQSNGL